MADNTAGKKAPGKKPAPPADESKPDKFVRLADRRINKALNAIGTIKPLANKNQYEFTEDQCLVIDKVLTDAVTDVRNAFRNALEGKRATSSPTFSLKKTGDGAGGPGVRSA